MSRKASRAGAALAAVGALSLMIELGLYWLSPYYFGQPHAIKAPPVILGSMLGFVGFYLLDHEHALEGGKFLVQSAEGLLAVVRGGAKRPGDVVIGKTEAAPAAEVVAATPAPAQPSDDPASATAALRAAVVVIDHTKPIGTQVDGEGD
jgi:hypothetical protein